jgi:endoglucanase
MKSFCKFILLSAILMAISISASAGYRVDNNRIYDGNNQEVQLRGVNWFGFQQNDYTVHGLWARNWRSQIFQMKNTGVNAVRLPFCPGTLQETNMPKTGTINYNMNPELEGKNALQLLDMVVGELNNENMYVLLDHHTPECTEITGLWYTNNYSEAQWLNDLEFVANRYKNLPYVLGIDIKNEPHGAATWGTGGATDWKRAAKAASDRILAVAPDMLIFVEGIEDNNDALPNTAPCSTAGHWWGGNFEPMNCYPLDVPANRLVLSPHVYGPDVYVQSYFNDPNFPANMPAIWDLHYGSFAGQHPIVFGEFGGRHGHDGMGRVANPKDPILQNALVDYMIEKGLQSSFYWSWNPNSTDTGGILQEDWINVWQDKVELLHRLWNYTPGAPVHGCSDGKDNDGDGMTDGADFGCENGTDDDEFNYARTSQGVQVTRVENNDWGTGYYRKFSVKNTNAFPIYWIAHVPADGDIVTEPTGPWGATFAVAGNEFVFEGVGYYQILRPDQTAEFGFSGKRNGPPPPPPPVCNDGLDNDGDGLVDMNDPGCENPQDTSEVDGPASGYLPSTVRIVNDWGGGYCGEVDVKNTTTAPVDWTTSFTFEEGTLGGPWNVQYTVSGNTVSVEGTSNNNVIDPDDTLTFGFCVTRPPQP